MLRTLVIGYGNPLRGDDGVGGCAAERLRVMVSDPAVEILSLHQLTPELMEPISRAGRVIFIDACAGPNPGEIRERRVEPKELQRAAFTHHPSPESLVAGARTLYGRAGEATLVTVVGADFSLSSDLSPVVRQRMDDVLAAVLRLSAADH